MIKNVYIAGPMNGLPYFNFPAFMKASEELRNQGFSVFNPAEEDIKTYGSGISECETGTFEEAVQRCETPPNYRDCLRKDLIYLLDHADAIALLPGWEKSKGARVEKALADCLSLETIILK